MRKLEKNFVSNQDKCGDQSFELIKRTNDVAMYKRSEGDRVFGYEVFKIKTRLKGQPLPGGVVEKEDRECYPGTKAFGKTAWFFPTEGVADIKYDLLVNGPVTKAKIEKIVKKGNGKRGRPKKDPVKLNIPDSKFTMNDLLKVNVHTGISKASLYVEVQKLIKCDRINVIGEVKSKVGRGKPMKVYQQINN